MKTQARFRWKSLLALALLALLPAVARSQSLWHEGLSKSMYADKRAAGVGDIITILVEENSTASKNNETKTEKNSSLTAAIASFLYPQSAGGFLAHKGQMPAMQYNSDFKHDGSGSINDSEAVIAKIAVRIIDVQPDNTVYSYNVADATIQIIGKGTVTDSQRKGWFTRIWDKLNPF